MMLATATGNMEMCRLLVEHLKADPNLPSVPVSADHNISADPSRARPGPTVSFILAADDRLLGSTCAHERLREVRHSFYSSPSAPSTDFDCLEMCLHSFVCFV